MPINHPYDPRYNAKVYVPKLTEEERLARATPLENLRGLRYRSEIPTAPVAPPFSPQIETVEIAPPQPVTPEVPTVGAPSADVPTPEPSTPEPAPQDDLAPDYAPAAWEVVFAAFPELYPERAARACAAVAVSDEANSAHSQPPERFRAPVFSSRPDAATKLPKAGSVEDAPWRTGVPPASRRRRNWRILDIPATARLRSVRGNVHRNTEAARMHEVPT